jgi:hypothetical protein
MNENYQKLYSKQLFLRIYTIFIHFRALLQLWIIRKIASEALGKRFDFLLGYYGVFGRKLTLFIKLGKSKSILENFETNGSH